MIVAAIAALVAAIFGRRSIGTISAPGRCRFTARRPTLFLASHRAGFSLCERDPSRRPMWHSSPPAYGWVGGDGVQLRDTPASSFRGLTSATLTQRQHLPNFD